MDWFYYIVGKLFIWGTGVLIILSVGYYLGYNHTALPVLKDFKIIRSNAATPLPTVFPDPILETLEESSGSAESTSSARPDSKKNTSQKN